jgi:hypothetical protein
MTYAFTAEDMQALAQWDTPTICNALELLAPERRAIGFTVEPMVALLKWTHGWDHFTQRGALAAVSLIITSQQARRFKEPVNTFKLKTFIFTT